jgi:triosephosphate isomerase
LYRFSQIILLCLLYITYYCRSKSNNKFMERRKIAAGNWKMNNSFEEGLQLTRALCNADKQDNVEVILGAPYIHLKSLVDLCLYVPHVDIAAQNCHQEESGAYTGEISAGMLSSISVPYVIIGHSERRQYFGETHEILAAKLEKALKHNLKPIFCCGELLEIRKAGQQEDVVAKQIEESLFKLDAEDVAKCIIAYEPVWAIGTGETASPAQAQEMHHFIRSFVAGKYGKELADTIPILYGGSVKPSNANEIFSQEDVDGGLVGGASLKAADFLAIINAF